MVKKTFEDMAKVCRLPVQSRAVALLMTCFAITLPVFANGQVIGTVSRIYGCS